MNFTLKKQLVKVSEVHKCKSPLENFHEVLTLFPNSVALHCPQCCPIVRRFDGRIGDGYKCLQKGIWWGRLSNIKIFKPRTSIFLSVIQLYNGTIERQVDKNDRFLLQLQRFTGVKSFIRAKEKKCTCILTLKFEFVLCVVY